MIAYKSSPEELKEISSHIWEHEVVRTLLKLLDEADAKQKELATLLKSYPNLRLTARYNFGSFSSFNGGGVRTKHLSNGNSCATSLALIIICAYPMCIAIFVLLIVGFILVILDLFIYRDSEKGRQFMNKLYSDHPYLDLILLKKILRLVFKISSMS